MSNKDFEKPKAKIVYIRLITGDEIVGDCLGEDETSTMIILKSPMVMSEVINPYTHSLGITLSKYMIFGNHEVIPIKNDHIVTITTPVKELEEFYNSSVVFNEEIACREIAEELSRADKATRVAIMEERENVGIDEIEVEEDSILYIPANTTLH